MNIVGLISDTHGLLRPEAVQALQGVDLILHAGDVGRPEVLHALREIAPVLAVRGNVDHGEWAASLPVTVAVEIGAAHFYMIHNIAELDRHPVPPGTDVVVYGHSHKANQEDRNGILYLNAGSAGPQRFRLPVTVATLKREAGAWVFKLFRLL